MLWDLLISSTDCAVEGLKCCSSADLQLWCKARHITEIYFECWHLWGYSTVVHMWTSVSEEHMTYIFRAEKQPSKKPACTRWLGRNVLSVNLHMVWHLYVKSLFKHVNRRTCSSEVWEYIKWFTGSAMKYVDGLWFVTTRNRNGFFSILSCSLRSLAVFLNMGVWRFWHGP
jgi:hypothetical protein